MSFATMGSTERQTILHFDQLLRDCKSPFRFEGRSLEKWTPFGVHIDDPDVANITVAGFMIALVLMIVSLTIGSVALTLLFLCITLVFGYSMTKLEEETREAGFRTGPGFIKKYHVSMTNAVERVYQGLSFGKVPFTVFDVTLTDWPDRPRATVFRTERSDLTVSVFKDKSDPYFTVVHIGGYSERKRRAVTTLKRLLDGHVPDP